MPDTILEQKCVECGQLAEQVAVMGYLDWLLTTRIPGSEAARTIREIALDIGADRHRTKFGQMPYKVVS